MCSIYILDSEEEENIKNQKTLNTIFIKELYKLQKINLSKCKLHDLHVNEDDLSLMLKEYLLTKEENKILFITSYTNDMKVLLKNLLNYEVNNEKYYIFINKYECVS